MSLHACHCSLDEGRVLGLLIQSIQYILHSMGLTLLCLEVCAVISAQSKGVKTWGKKIPLGKLFFLKFAFLKFIFHGFVGSIENLYPNSKTSVKMGKVFVNFPLKTCNFWKNNDRFPTKILGFLFFFFPLEISVKSMKLAKNWSCSAVSPSLLVNQTDWFVCYWFGISWRPAGKGFAFSNGAFFIGFQVIRFQFLTLLFLLITNYGPAPALLSSSLLWQRNLLIHTSS